MKNLRLLSWNVNGIRAVCKKGFLEWLETEQPDVLCLQETKAREEQLEKILECIKGYHWKFVHATTRKGYSGVVIFSKAKPLEFSEGFGDKSFDEEGRCVVAKYPEFTLFNVYFPNGKASPERLAYKMAYYESFLKQMQELKEKGENIIICGDVNTAHKPIDLARPKANEKISGFLPEEREWMDRFFAAGFVDTLREFNQEPGLYSWWDQKSRARDRNVGWRIDYFFVNQALRPNLKSAAILSNIFGSDHCPVELEIEFQ